ncbi:MAG: triose-phosphate isomerase, partial [Acidimicrobiales bacterium]
RERDAGQTRERLTEQVEAAIGDLAPEAVAGMVIAYEPIWAIGSGQASTAGDAKQAGIWIREVVERVAGAGSADTVRIQYGGSVTAENAAELLACHDIDGVLVGSASLDAGAFVAIIRAASSTGR